MSGVDLDVVICAGQVDRKEVVVLLELLDEIAEALGLERPPHQVRVDGPKVLHETELACIPRLQFDEQRHGEVRARALPKARLYVVAPRRHRAVPLELAGCAPCPVAVLGLDRVSVGLVHRWPHRAHHGKLGAVLPKVADEQEICQPLTCRVRCRVYQPLGGL